MNEKEIISGCLKENRTCQKALYERYSGKMYALCLRYARHRLEAEDILQEGFIRVFEKLHTFKGLGSLESWIRRIMINMAIKNYRKLNFNIEQLGLEDYQIRGVAPDVYSSLSIDELMNLISELPEGYRIVFNLFVIEGYPHREIAEMLGIKESTSRSQLAKARRLIVKRLKQQNEITEWKLKII